MISSQIQEYYRIFITIWVYYVDSIQIQSTCKDLRSITRILAEFLIEYIIIYFFGNSPYLKKFRNLKYNFNIIIVAQIRGEYKVYKLPYNIIAGFFSLRGYIFVDNLWSLLVMPYILFLYNAPFFHLKLKLSVGSQSFLYFIHHEVPFHLGSFRSQCKRLLVHGHWFAILIARFLRAYSGLFLKKLW
jgi:hypothetical protein